MKRNNIYLMLLFLFISLALSAQETKWIAGELLIQFKPTTDLFQAEDFINNTKIINVTSSRLISRRMKIWHLILNEKNTDLFTLMKELKQNKLVKAVQLNHQVELRELLPNDPEFIAQWALKNIGNNQGIIDADIDATDAWDTSIGGFTANGDEIVVAIIDSGCELTHPDISYWKNELEIPNNSIDDDLNGYIDDYDGWNAYTHSGQVSSSSHGTHVAGISSAIGNNGLGVCGVNWNSKVMPISGSSNTEAIVVEAYSYVLEMRALYNETNGLSGAYVVATNASFGIDYANPINYPIWCAMYDSLGAVGVLNCGATANANINVDVSYDMPTACDSDYLITVTNTNNQDIKNNSAGYGANSIDLGAPGTQIRSTDLSASYSYKSGTSMSTPHVTGAIALLYSAMPQSLLNTYSNNPEELALLVKSYILEGADSLSSLQGITLSGGRLNVYNSMMLMLNNENPLNPVRNFTAIIQNNNAVLSWESPLVNPELELISYNIYRNDSQINTSLVSENAFIDYNLQNDNVYAYSVSAVYAQGESPVSDSIELVLLKSVNNLSAESGDETVHLFWQAPSESSFRTILGYNIYRDNLLINLSPIVALEYIDSNLQNDLSYDYFLTVLYSHGESDSSNHVNATPTQGNNSEINHRLIPNENRLNSNYPNPFNPQTYLSFDLKERTLVKISIYNLKGQILKILSNKEFNAGHHQLLWDGKDMYSKPASSGIYLYKMETGTFTQQRKMLLIK